MPRNPSTGIYTLPPGTGGTPNQPISSTMFNTFAGDVAQDLNGARPISAGGTGATNASQARTNLGLAIGTNVQAYDAGLQSIAGLTTAADRMIYTTAADVYATTALTAFARTILDDTTGGAVLTTLGVSAFAQTILDDANAAAARTTLGLGTSSTVNTGTSGATIPLLNAANTWSLSQGFGAGIQFGSSTAPAANDTSRHIALYGTPGTSGYGFTITGSRLNVVAPTTADVAFVDSVTNTDRFVFDLAAGNASFTGGLSLGTALAVSEGGTGATTAAAARTNLGVPTGTSGAVLPFLNGANTWSGVQTFTGNPIITNTAPNLIFRDTTSGSYDSRLLFDANNFAIQGSADGTTFSTKIQFEMDTNNVYFGTASGNALIWNGTAVPLAVGGTGATTAAAARSNLGLGSLATLNTAPVANGGTGATTAAAARENLGLSDLSNLIYTGSSSSNTSFPVGEEVWIVAAATQISRNGTVTPALHDSVDRYYVGAGTANAGSSLAGTWRSRGATIVSDATNYLMKRTA